MLRGVGWEQTDTQSGGIGCQNVGVVNSFEGQSEGQSTSN